MKENSSPDAGETNSRRRMDQATTSAFGDMVVEAISRLSDESEENNSNRNHVRKSELLPDNNKYDLEVDCESDEGDDDDDDDDETKQLLPSTSTTTNNNKKSRKHAAHKKSKDRAMVAVAANIGSAALHRHTGNQHRQNNNHHHHHLQQSPHLQQPPPQKQRQQSYNRANKYSGEYDSTDIVNENIMGLTPPAPTSSNPISGRNVIVSDPDNNRDQESIDDKERSLCNVNWYIYSVTILSAIGGFMFGYDTGIVSGAMVFIRDDFHLSTFMQEVVVSVTILTAWLFSFVAGYLSNKFGRKLVIMLASFVFTVGGVMMALAHKDYVLLIGRAIVGLAIGLSSMAVPVYIAEVAPMKIRGKLVSTNVGFITFGQFIASIVAGLFSHNPHGWRWMLGLASVPSFLQLVFFFFLPESPRWLVQRQQYDEAYSALKKFRYADTHENKIVLEFEEIKESCLSSERERNDSKSIRTFLSKPAILKALLVGSLLSIYQQVAGINTVMYYSATIIQMSGVNDKSTAVWLSALTSSINFIFSFVGIVLVERLGRRLLLLSSLTGVVLSLLILAAGFQMAHINSPSVSFNSGDGSPCSALSNCDECIQSKCGYCFYDSEHKGKGPQTFDSLLATGINGTCLALNQSKEQPEPYPNSTYCVTVNGTSDSMTLATNWCPSQYSLMTLIGLMLYLFFFAPGMGPMPWTINSEIYPLWARSFCYSVSTSFNWFFNLLVSLTFLSLTNLLTIHGAFYLYACLAFSGLVLFFFLLPETKGKSLEEIETLFEGPLCSLAKNSKNLSQYENVDGSVNASQSTVMTSSTTSSNVKI